MKENTYVQAHNHKKLNLKKKSLIFILNILKEKKFNHNLY